MKKYNSAIEFALFGKNESLDLKTMTSTKNRVGSKTIKKQSKKEDKMNAKRTCKLCGKKITKSKDIWYSIVIYDEEYKKANGKIFCPKCAKLIYRIIVAHYEKVLYPIRDLMTDRLGRLKQLKSNVKNIK